MKIINLVTSSVFSNCCQLIKIVDLEYYLINLEYYLVTVNLYA